MKDITFTDAEVESIQDHMLHISDEFHGDRLQPEGNRFALFAHPYTGECCWGYGRFGSGVPDLKCLYFCFRQAGEYVEVETPGAVLDSSGVFVELFRWALCAAQTAGAKGVYCDRTLGMDDNDNGGLQYDALSTIGLVLHENPASPSKPPVYLQETGKMFRTAERAVYYPVSRLGDGSESYHFVTIAPDGSTRDCGVVSVVPDTYMSIRDVVLNFAEAGVEGAPVIEYLVTNLRRVFNGFIAAPGNLMKSQKLVTAVFKLLCDVLHSLGYKYHEHEACVVCLENKAFQLPLLWVHPNGTTLKDYLYVDMFADVRSWDANTPGRTIALTQDMDYAMHSLSPAVIIREVDQTSVGKELYGLNLLNLG